MRRAILALLMFFGAASLLPAGDSPPASVEPSPNETPILAGLHGLVDPGAGVYGSGTPLPPIASSLPFPLRRAPHWASHCFPYAGDLYPHHGQYPLRVVGETLLLWRDNQAGLRNVIVNQAAVPQLDTQDFSFDTVGGLRLFGQFFQPDGRGLELGYFGLHNWSETQILLGNNNLALPDDLGANTLDFATADRFDVDYDSEIHSAEGSFVVTIHRTELMAGFRYFRLDEEFELAAQNIGGGDSAYTTRTRNMMYGFQVGARGYREFRRVRLEATGKAGIYGNDARQHNLVLDDDSTIELRNEQTRRTDLAFVGELSANAGWRITPVLTVRGGYTLLWVDGVALAPDQLDFTDNPLSGTVLHTGGSVFMHGATAGVEARW